MTREGACVALMEGDLWFVDYVGQLCKVYTVAPSNPSVAAERAKCSPIDGLADLAWRQTRCIRENSCGAGDRGRGGDSAMEFSGSEAGFPLMMDRSKGLPDMSPSTPILATSPS